MESSLLVSAEPPFRDTPATGVTLLDDRDRGVEARRVGPYDRRHHMARRRQRRLGRLTASNPALAASEGGVSAVLLDRTVVAYPETVALARALVTLPRAAPRDTPHQAADTRRRTRALAHIADHLELPRLVVAPDDLLWARLHHHNPAWPVTTGVPMRADTHLGPPTPTPRNPRGYLTTHQYINEKTRIVLTKPRNPRPPPPDPPRETPATTTRNHQPTRRTPNQHTKPQTSHPPTPPLKCSATNYGTVPGGRRAARGRPRRRGRAALRTPRRDGRGDRGRLPRHPRPRTPGKRRPPPGADANLAGSSYREWLTTAS
jgi:hypothetical protein